MGTLSSSADAAAVITTSSTMSRYGLPRARLAAQIARCSKTPVCLSTPTITIMPSSRKMTFQSTPLSLEKNAASALLAWISSMIPAPPRAAATRWMRSVAISA